MPRPLSRVSQVVVSGPLVPFIEAYRWELRRRGYTPLTVVNLLRQVARLSQWLDDRGLGVEEFDAQRVEEFLAFQRAEGRHRAQWSRPGLWCLLALLEGLGVLEHERPVPVLSPSEALLGSFESYLLSERALAAGTVRGYVDHARRFLDGLPPDTALGAVSAAEVIAALRRVAGAVSVSTAQNFRAGLRAFLRFCFIEGILAVDLSGAALAVTGRRREFLPAGSNPPRLARCLAPVIAGPRSGDATTQRWSCSSAWACVPARWPGWAWTTSTGAPASSLCAARARAWTGCPCPRRWARRSPPICNADDPEASDERCSCEPELRSDRSRSAQSDRPCVGRADAPGSPRSAHTGYATRWLVRWSAPECPWSKSVRCYATRVCSRARSMPGWT